MPFLYVRRSWLLVVGLVCAIMLAGSLAVHNVLSPGTKGKVVVIDPGHGGQDPGAQFAGLKEKDLNLDVALRLRQALEAKGCQVILTRDADKDYYAPGLVRGRTAKRIELNQRINIAAVNQADLFVSIHTNSYPKGNSYGAETYYHLQSAPGKALAERIQAHLRQVQPDNRRQAKAGDYYLINQTKMPAVLVEMGFLSNPKERKLLTNDSYKDQIARAISGGIEQFFDDYPFGVPDSTPALSPLDSGPPPAKADSFQLFFPSVNQDTLTAEARQITSSRWQSIPAAQKIRYILTELVKGPHSNSELSFIPPATQVLDVNVQNGIATVDFSGNLRDQFAGGASPEEMTVKSIVWSATQISGIQGVRILIDGQLGDSVGGHILLDHTLTPVPKTAKAAIVIDDFGINNPGTDQMLNLGVPITAAVMPNLPFSQAEAEQLHRQGYEIIMHVPVEPKQGQANWLGPGALRSSQTKEQIHASLESSLKSVPYCVGISNHMGSRGTEDLKITQEIVAVAKEHSLLVLDSKTSEGTILAKQAAQAGLPWEIRDVFLDNSADLNSIKKQLRLLIDTAKKKGKAVGIGHVGPQGPLTARAIREMLPEFEKSGIQLVPLSELTQG